MSALVFFALALTLMFAPNRIVGDWGLDVTLSVEVAHGLYELNAGSVRRAILIPVFIEVAMLLALVAAGRGQTAAVSNA